MARVFPTLCLAGALLGLASSAHAQDPACTSLPRPVIGVGGSASTPLLKRIGTQLAGAASPITVIYQSPGACFAITHYVDGTPITGNATYWDAAGAQHTCTLGAVGVRPDFGMAGNGATLCNGVTSVPSGIGDFAGPVTSWSVIVPVDSTQQSIAAEALYFIYGFGGAAGGVAPWNDDAFVFGRNATSAAQIELGLAIGVPAASFHAIDTSSNQGTVNALHAATDPEASIGFTSTEVVDANPTLVRTLAYQHYDQSCGYWPSSTATAFDRRNVRDGHYYLWSQYHFFAPVDGTGAISDADTAELIGYFTGDATPPAGVNVLQQTILNGNIPQCAMTVWRDTDIGPLYSFVPPFSCGCYFEEVATGSAPATCTPCSSSTDCAGTPSTPFCHYGYCEVS
ncbi:MAG: hypothetical protein U0234_22085 [Sandaracinus sp.]